MVKRKKYQRKTWWQKHWDEVLLWGSIFGGIYFILKGIGTI